MDIAQDVQTIAYITLGIQVFGILLLVALVNRERRGK